MENLTPIIEKLKLLPHPEGGYYREIYRSNEMFVDAKGMQNQLSTSIYFLLPGGKFSALHKISFDEQWFFLQGNPLVIFEIIDGLWHETIINEENPWHLVKGGTWFGSRPLLDDGYALVSCCVVPAFNMADLVLASSHQLTQQYPQLSAQITQFSIVF